MNPKTKASSAPNYDESQVPLYTLPNPLINHRGQKVVSREEWNLHRRGEIYEDFCKCMYGRIPAPLRFSVQELERGSAVFGNRALRDQVRLVFHHPKTREITSDSPYVDILIYRPKTDLKVPVFLGLNFWGNHATVDEPLIPITPSNSKMLPNAPVPGEGQPRGYESSRWPYEEIVAAGYGVATCYYGDIASDDLDGWRNGVAKWLLPNGKGLPHGDEPGAIALWAWGLSRCIDYLETRAEFDPAHIAVIGHSRLGKAALWCAASDPRIALVISNNSGCAGAAISRRCFGETFASCIHSFPHWYCGNFREYGNRESELPVDQHELLALLAPRPVYVASATMDLWADPKGEFLSTVEASPVYRLLGGEGIPSLSQPLPDTPLMSRNIGYHIRTGEHQITHWDWQQYLQFASCADW